MALKLKQLWQRKMLIVFFKSENRQILTREHYFFRRDRGTNHIFLNSSEQEDEYRINQLY